MTVESLVLPERPVLGDVVGVDGSVVQPDHDHVVAHFHVVRVGAKTLDPDAGNLLDYSAKGRRQNQTKFREDTTRLSQAVKRQP